MHLDDADLPCDHVIWLLRDLLEAAERSEIAAVVVAVLNPMNEASVVMTGYIGPNLMAALALAQQQILADWENNAKRGEVDTPTWTWEGSR